MNLINFHKDPKNEQFIRENQIGFCGQGLYHSYWVMPIGNGHNRYIFTIESHGKLYKIVIKEKYVLEWQIGAQFSEDYPDALPHDTISFKALGRVESTGQYIGLTSGGCRDFVHLNDTLKVMDIEIQNDRPDVPFLHVTNENQLWDDIMGKRQEEYYEKMENRVDIDCKQKMEYGELFDESNWGVMLYLVIDHGVPFVIPFMIIRMDRGIDNDMMDACLFYNWVAVDVIGIKLFLDSECEDIYDISIDMVIEYEELGERVVERVHDYCYVVR